MTTGTLDPLDNQRAESPPNKGKHTIILKTPLGLCRIRRKDGRASFCSRWEDGVDAVVC
jgi:hypothetical protein